MTPARNGRFAVEPPEAGGPRRSALLQERSRHTRRQLVRAAITLWTDRGFESGIEDTTVEEIAREAGVTKGTFYFHFAHKEDILLEIGWATAEAMLTEAEGAMRRGRTTSQVVDGILSSLARRIARVRSWYSCQAASAASFETSGRTMRYSPSIGRGASSLVMLPPPLAPA